MLSTIKLLLSNIGNVIALLQLIPTLIGLVHEVESPGVPGATKKNAVLTLLQDTLNFATGSLKMNLPTTTIMAWANSTVDTIVGILNTFGTLLPHGSVTTPAIAPAAPMVVLTPPPANSAPGPVPAPQSVDNSPSMSGFGGMPANL